MSNGLENWIEVGKIVGAQGLNGELRIYPLSDFPERFESPGKRWLYAPDGSEAIEVELLSGRYIPHKNLYVVKLSGVENRDRAEALQGYKMLVDKSDRPVLQEDEYHVDDLVGLEVYDRYTRENIGVVVDIFSAGNDLLEVRLHQDREPEIDSKKSPKVLIPFVKAIVPVVDLRLRRIEIDPPPGLLTI
jgi:16S rRNA processing protein RimM